MRILGIDPGLGTTGYGIIEDPSASSLGMVRPSISSGRMVSQAGSIRRMTDSSNYRNFKIVEAGIIRTAANTPIQSRLKKIFNSVCEIIEEHKPAVLVLEKIYSHYKHPTTAILMSHARAVICLACGINGVNLINYPSTKIKKTITGNGQASKQQVQRMIQDIFKLKNPLEPVDVSDALAMAVAYCYLKKGSELGVKGSKARGS